MEQHFQQSSSIDYSLKDGETIVINLKNVRTLIYTSIISATLIHINVYTCFISIFIYVTERRWCPEIIISD